MDFVVDVANQAASDWIGQTEAALIGARLLELLPARAGARLVKIFAHTVDSGEPILLSDITFPITFKNAAVYYDVHGIQVGDALSFTWRDVTERHLIAERFRLLSENAADVVFQTSPDGTIEWISTSVNEILGWEPEELIGKNLNTIPTPNLADWWVKADLEQESDRHSLQVFVLEVVLENKTGTPCRFFLNSQEVRDPRGTLIARIGSLRNIDVEHAAKLALSESEAKYRLLAEAASDIVFRASPDGHIEWISPSVLPVLGWRPQDLIGTTISDIRHPDDSALRDERIKQLASHDHLTFAERYLDAKGVYHHFAVTIKNVIDAHGIVTCRVGGLRSTDAEQAALTELLRSEGHYRLLAENASDVVYQANNDGLIEWISPSVQRVLGWLPETLIGTPFMDLIHDDDLSRAHLYRARVLNGRPTGILELRYKTASGTTRWMSVQSRPVRGGSGEVMSAVVGLREIEDVVRTRLDLEQSLTDFRRLAEHASDIVFETDAEGVIKWISPSVSEELGWSPEKLHGRRATELIYERNLAAADAWRSLVYLGEKVENVEARFLTVEHETRWMSVMARPIRGATHAVVGAVVALRNCQQEVITRRALRTLSAGSGIVARSQEELDLLSRMCQAAVDEGGYLFAWYSRRVDDELHSVIRLASSRDHAAYLSEIDLSWSDDPSGWGPTGRALRLGETVVIADVREDREFATWLESAMSHGFRSVAAFPVIIDGEIDGAVQVYAPEPNAFDEFAVETLQDLAEQIGVGIARLRDNKRLLSALASQRLLSSAIDQAGESIIVTDPASSIVYANHSALEITGLSLDSVIGENPRIFQSGLQDRRFYDEMWSRLTEGSTWSGVFLTRRPDGVVVEEESTIAPIHDAAGSLAAYVCVKRDVSAVNRLEATLAREQKDQTDMVKVMGDVHQLDTVQLTAEALSRSIVEFKGIDIAIVFLVQGDHNLVGVGASGSTGLTLSSNAILWSNEAKAILEHSDAGPWWFKCSDPPRDIPSRLLDDLRSEGVTVAATIPIRWNTSLIGILALATRDPLVDEWINARRTTFEQLGMYAGTLLGAQANSYEHRQSTRTKLLAVMKDRAFRPYFQPFVDLASGEIVGYEALTRFDDGVRPDLRFIEAHSVGLGSELEASCAVAAIEASRGLAPDLWLSVNFSPSALLDGHAATALEHAARSLVIEITEHDEILDYPAVRQAISAIEGCRLAVDDAGAGYTSLMHILELKPDFVKLDISLVRGIDLNPARRSMVAGICHFAAQSDTTLIAEGIETQGEADTLLELGFAIGGKRILGQGFLYGHPSPLPPTNGSTGP